MPLNTNNMHLKNLTFAIGLAWLLYGAMNFGYPDWDIGVSLVMAGFTYLFAEWAVKVFMERDYEMWGYALLAIWWCVDGSYTTYWAVVDRTVMIRAGQWPMSLCLFLLCGFVWRLCRELQTTRLRRMP